MGSHQMFGYVVFAALEGLENVKMLPMQVSPSAIEAPRVSHACSRCSQFVGSGHQASGCGASIYRFFRLLSSARRSSTSIGDMPLSRTSSAPRRSARQALAGSDEYITMTLW